MCIRDSDKSLSLAEVTRRITDKAREYGLDIDPGRPVHTLGCLLYTSDAADERSSVDLGGRRIIKKQT